MNPLVVLFACLAAASASYVAQPHNHPAIVLDAHARPLDTAEVIHARAIHYQAKALEHTPLLNSGVSTYANPLVGYGYGNAGHGYGYGNAGLGYGYGNGLGGHYLNKRSLGDVHSRPSAAAYGHSLIGANSGYGHSLIGANSGYGHSLIEANSGYGHSLIGANSGYGHSLIGANSGYGHSLIGANSGFGHSLAKRSYGAYAHIPAVSHQSRIDVISRPAIVSHAVASPVLAHSAPLVHHAAPIIAHAAPAVSHQSRVDVISSPAYGSQLAHSGLLSSHSNAGLYSHAALW